VGLTAPTLCEGARADLTLIDPEARHTIDPSRFMSKGRNTPFAGRAVRGRVIATVIDGRVAHEDAGMSRSRA
jgi:dihydroorotase